MPSDSISIFLFVVSVQFVLLCSIGSSQKAGFTSIDCGASYPSTYTATDGIVWISDSNLTSQGISVRLSDNVLNQMLATMRLFNGTQSKYCYSFTNSMNSYIVPKAFFLVRASIMPGTNPPYTPKSSDGMFRFKMIVDGDEWQDVEIPYGDTRWWTYDVYMRPQRNSIDVCFARDSPDGDAPFVSGLELRPLPDTLSTTVNMTATGRIFLGLGHFNFGVETSALFGVRYPNDTFDRFWIPRNASIPNMITTEETINTLNVRDQPPQKILQSAYTASPYFAVTTTGLEVGSKHYVQFYFAEIDPLVTAGGMRVFNVSANDKSLTSTPLDVFSEVGANTAYSFAAMVDPDVTGAILFSFNTVPTPTFSPFLAAAELFNTRLSNTLTPSVIDDWHLCKDCFSAVS
ncbi:hypothetical protein KP509_18G023800 [Ceratopteris richardii]|uniref:Malectin-like domain-containing protein n=1 Tax=Ceratopteris richardii TaxID=49495 RepID=A0A8T2SN93_CERRI|nr:hypothetical protein KP509_18G023800 [Ceratopteris richardii]